MELIPILSLIILFTTVCTVILAIVAYYHYKSKERKRNVARMRKPDFIQAELVTPAPFVPDQSPMYAKAGPTGTRSKYTGNWAADDYYRFNTPVQGNVHGRADTGYVKSGSTYKEKRRPGHKFMRYTPAGYLEPLTDTHVSKKKVPDKVRWR